MIRDIQVFSKGEAEKFISFIPWAAISISTEPDNWPVLSTENRVGLLQLAFWDACGPRLAYPGITLFDRDFANQILDFVTGVQDKAARILVHCEAGISRSPAVAAVLHMLYIEPNDQWWFARYCPNSLVYSTLLETAVERGLISVEQLIGNRCKRY